MNSATSTSEVRLKADAQPVRLEPPAAEGTHSFRPAHFFVLASLLAATAAVAMSRQSSPEHLVLVSLMIAAAGLAAAGFYRMLSPLVTEIAPSASEPISERARAVLQREKLLVMRAIKDLEFDRSMGKVSQADFEEMAGRLRTRAMLLMKQLDEDGSGYRSAIERELSQRLATQPAPAAQAQTQIDQCGCGAANDPDAVFCKKCGTRLASQPSAPIPDA